MVQVATTIENDFRDAAFLSLLACDLTESGSALDVSAILARGLEIRAQGGNAAQGLARNVVDELHVDVVVAARHAKTGTLRRAGDLTAHATMATGQRSLLFLKLIHGNPFVQLRLRA